MDKKTFTDAFRVKLHMERQLNTDCLWIVVTMDLANHELLSLDYQNAFAESQRTIGYAPGVKGRIERFFSRLDRQVLTLAEIESVEQLTAITNEYLNTLRNAEGRVFL